MGKSFFKQAVGRRGQVAFYVEGTLKRKDLDWLPFVDSF